MIFANLIQIDYYFSFSLTLVVYFVGSICLLYSFVVGCWVRVSNVDCRVLLFLVVVGSWFLRRPLFS
jgi:hypothetical protein